MKKDKSLNDEQNLAVYSRGSSILVSAPAGSGKTKILVNRMMSLIEDDHVSVDSLLVLTFTKAAALEMKQRLVESLNKRIHVVDDSLKVHLEKQKILLNDAYITNFHSFCSDLLSQYGYTIHLDSKFEILENPTLIKENILNQCLEKWVQEKEFYDFYQENYTGYQFNSFKEILFQLDNLSHTVYHFDDYLDQVKIKLYDRVINDQTIEDTPFEKPLKKILHEAFQEAYDSYLKLEDYCQTYGLGFYFEETKKLPAPHTVLENYFQNLKECFNQGKYFSMGIEIEKHRAASYKDVDDSIKETYKSLLDQTKNTFSKAYQKCMPSSIEELSEVLKVSYRHLEIYLKFLKEFQKKYQAYKKSLSYLDFNDLEQYTLQLLSENQGVAQTLYQQFHEIMIDEYQDTNEIQENLILLISRFQKPEINRFMVGDMKQSIYRFRKADLDIFNEKYLTYGLEDNNQRIDLKFNYRSNKIVLDSINYIFNAIMDRRYGGLEYDNDPHAQLNYDFLRKEKCDTDEKLQKAMLRYDQEKRFDSEIMLVLKPEDETVDMIEYEAKMIGKKIHEMVGHLELDFYTGNRLAKYQDVVVLMRNVANFITYKKVFDAISIPNLIVLTKGFFESNEILDCVYFLKALDNCLDDLALISLLKGNYKKTRFDENWLYLHKIENTSVYESLKQAADQEAIDFLNYYHEMQEFARNHPVYEVLERFIKENEYDLFISSLYNGKQRYANVQLLIEMLKADEGLSLYQIVHKFEQTMTLGIDYKPATLSSDGDAVTFMTIHQSKGLEFPIVIVNQMNHQFNFADGKAPLIQDKNLGIILNPHQKQDLGDFQNVLIEYPHPLRGIFSTVLDNETINEEMRILYVALTRASQKLILTGGLKEINMIEKWQKQVIDYALDASCHLLPATIRKSNQMLNWIMLALIRHPDFIQQCIDLSLFDEKIKNYYDLDQVKNNALQLKLYQEKKMQLNTCHSKFHTSIIDVHTIDEYIYPTSQIEHNDQELYLKNSQFNYQNKAPFDKTVAVTSIIDDGNRFFERDDEENESSMKATDRGTLVHLFLELYPLDKELNFEECFQNIIQRSLFNEEARTLLNQYKFHLESFIESDVYQLMLKSSYCYKEKEFSFLNENKQIIHGIFDVLCINEDKITIIDYKTDTLAKNSSDELLKELHQGQMYYYKKIMKQMFPNKEVEAIVYYLHIHRYVTL